MMSYKPNSIDIEYVRSIRRRKIIILVICTLIVLLLLIVFFNSMSERQKTAKFYAYAEELLSNKEYSSARHEFEKCGTYRDADNRILDCYYLEGIENYSTKNYTAAIKAFESARWYSDANEQIMICYKTVYKNAVEDAWKKRRNLALNGGLQYDNTWYAFSDITGDGIYELIICQQYNKHGEYNWIYRIESDTCQFMGEINDEGSMYGYRSGILLLNEYKGNYRLSLYEWTGTSYKCHKLADGEYDRDTDGPDIYDLKMYYDGSMLLGEITGFDELSNF